MAIAQGAEINFRNSADIVSADIDSDDPDSDDSDSVEDSGRNNAMTLACEHGHLDIVRYLVEDCNYNVHATFSGGYYSWRSAA